MDKADALRQLPAVGKLIQSNAAQLLLQQWPRSLVVSALAVAVNELRSHVVEQAAEATIGAAAGAGTLPPDTAGDAVKPCSCSAEEALAACAAAWLEERYRPNLRRVLNLTGTIIHTNLGRAPLSDRALAAIHSVAVGYSNLEYRVEAGARGSRHHHVARLLCELTGAEDAMVVNNNAAALFLSFAAVGAGGEAIVSRGQLVEIGGSFRIPDIMAESGVAMVEVGSTNKTHLADYERAIRDTTRLLVRVHESNYRIVGFTEQPALAALVTLAHGRGLPVFEDLGSGALYDYAAAGIGDEPTVSASVQAGVDIVSFSGDKLLGGAQAGIIVGKRDWIARLKQHPLARVVRVDKLTLAALEATLLDAVDGDVARERIPVVRMITEPYESVAARAAALAAAICSHPLLGPQLRLHLEDDVSTIGGGAFPGETLPTRVICVEAIGHTAAAFATALRQQPGVPVVGRIVHGVNVWDARTLLPDEAEILLDSLCEWAAHAQS